MPPSIWPWTACGLIALPTSCAVPTQTTRVRPEVDVDLDDDAHRGHRQRDVRALAGDLARLGIERRRRRGGGGRARRRPRRHRVRSCSSSAARQASRTAPATIHVSRDADAEPAEPTRRGRVRRQRRRRSVPSSVRATCRITSVTPWPTSVGGAVDGRAAVGVELDARSARVVEALRVADVLEPDREADAAADAGAARRVAGSARQADRIARKALGRGRLECGGAPDHLGGGERARRSAGPVGR